MHTKLTAIELVGLTDEELIERLLATGDEVAKRLRDSDLPSHLDGLLIEALERWAPEADWNVRRRDIEAFYADNTDGLRNEIDDMERARRTRMAARLRAHSSSGTLA